MLKAQGEFQVQDVSYVEAEEASAAGIGATRQLEGLFERLEDKFLISEDVCKSLVPLAQSRMRNAAPDPDTEWTRIRSVYFDSAKMDCLQSYLQSEGRRFKIRTRQYGPNGNWSEAIFLEYKAKVDGVGKKSRFQIGPQELKSISNGEPIELGAGLIALNNDIPERKLVKRVARVNSVIEELNVRPIACVEYSRLAFEDDAVRLTVDSDIETRFIQEPKAPLKGRLLMNKAWSHLLSETLLATQGGQRILELKHSGEHPAWLTQFLKRFGIMPQKFSKYSYASAKAFLPSRSDLGGLF